MAKRGVLYIVWGKKRNPELDAGLRRSMNSLFKYHPKLPVKIEELGGSATLLDKARMYDLSPFDETLYLDADTVVFDTLDFGFERAARHGLACCICESPWARRYPHAITSETIEYNTGVLFFSRAPAVAALFESWKTLSKTVDSRLPFRKPSGEEQEMACNDQASFARAIEETGFNPFVLPQNWNLRPAWQRLVCGPLKIWHDYAQPPGVVERMTAATRSPNRPEFWPIEGTIVSM